MIFIPPQEGLEDEMKFEITEDAFAQLENRYMNPERAFRVMINGFG